MGNTKVKEKLVRQSSIKFLGQGDEYKSRLEKFINEEMEGSPYEKFKFIESLVDDNDFI